MTVRDTGRLRTFATGATRDTSKQKLDPHGFLSPAALHRFSEYMDRHRLQADGSMRGSDNWKLGMPKEEYVRSLIRHVMDFWLVTDGEAPRYDKNVSDADEIACAILFNVQGYLHESLKETKPKSQGFVSGPIMGPIGRIDPLLDEEIEQAFERLTMR